GEHAPQPLGLLARLLAVAGHLAAERVVADVLVGPAGEALVEQEGEVDGAGQREGAEGVVDDLAALEAFGKVGVVRAVRRRRTGLDGIGVHERSASSLGRAPVPAGGARLREPW